MISYSHGDIFLSGAQAIVNTVNTEGVMGKGLALQFKQRYPGNYRAYVQACNRGAVRTGCMFVYATGMLTNPAYIINFPTKQSWRNPSKLEYITSGLQSLAHEICERHIQSIAIPPLGCGLGGLSWTVVRLEIEKALGTLPDVNVVLFEPMGR